MSSSSPYTTLITGKRRRGSTIAGRSVREEASSDRSRVIYSSPFRRLQQKAQVFSLEGNASVRTRLTHSLEVADVGRLIARRTSTELQSRGILDDALAPAFEDVVETACLMHDIGNPPFGHFGEAAINDWFRENGPVLDGMTDREKADFHEFDGNPQGLRIVTRLQRNVDEYGLNLTYSQLLSFLKYLRLPYERNDFEATGRRKGIFKKAGFFLTEQPIVSEALEAVGRSFDHRTRFPLAYIMEAADDIAYCISDIEDGVEKNIVDPYEVMQTLREAWEPIVGSSRAWRSVLKLVPRELRKRPSREEALEAFFRFKAAYARQMIQRAAEEYVRRHDEILEGTVRQLFDPERAESAVLESLKDVARIHLFCAPEAENLELTGYRVIRGILDHYKPLLSLSRDDFEVLLESRNEPARRYGRSLDIQWRLFHRLPKKYIQTYADGVARGVSEQFLRTHLVLDYIAGMTDRYALETFQMMSGARIDR